MKTTKQDNKAKYIEETKAAKTIKVKTLIVSILFIAALLATFIGGWVSRSNFDATIKDQVNAQVQELTQVSSTLKQ